MTYDLSGEYGVGVTNNGTEFLFDIEDYDKIKDMTWCVTLGYLHSMTTGKDIKMHRLIMDCPQGMVVDHINHNTLDNRKENLRICTNAQNICNKNHMSNNTSGKVGVLWRKDKQRWIAYIKVNGKLKHLGCFKDYESAVQARIAGEQFYFGEYAFIE